MSTTLVKEVVTVHCDIKHETEKALLVSTHTCEGEMVNVWIPLSQVESISRNSDMEEGLYTDSVVMSKWIATTKGLV